MKLEDLKPLQEMNVIAAWGDWKLGPVTISYITKQVINLKYEQVGEIKLTSGIKKILKLSDSNFYIVGDFVTKKDETKFEVSFEITFEPTEIPKHSVIFMNVEGVRVPNSLQGRGIALIVYRFFVKKLKFNILGDETQYFGARKLWAKLSKMVDVTVDIIDIRDGSFLEKDVVLHHGTEDWDFDHRVWSYNVDKKHIRLILKDV